MTASRKDHLVNTAIREFYKNGYHATGVEKILSSAGVSKPTLYRHFPSKDALIVAALEKWDEEARSWLKSEMERRAATPRDQILALFDTLADWFSEPGFQGCMFVNAAVEFSDQKDPIHLAAAKHKSRFADYVREVTAEAGADDPDEITEQIMLLMEGAIVTAHTSGRVDAAHRARKMAEKILDQAL